MTVTFQTLRRSGAHALKDLETVVVSAGAATSFTAPQLFNATTGASTTRLNGAWVFPTDLAAAGQQRRVRTGGLTPSTGVALIYPDWTAPTANSHIDITHLFPSIDDESGSGAGGGVSYRRLVNRALNRMPIPDQITVTTVAGAYSYSLATYGAWLTSRDRVMKVIGPPIVASYPGRDDGWRIDTLDFDGGVPTLRVRAPYAANGETIRLDVVRPAMTFISGAESTVGLVAETDYVLDYVREDEFLDVFLAEAYLALARRGHGGVNWAALVDPQEARAQATITRMDRRARGLPEEAPATAVRGAA